LHAPCPSEHTLRSDGSRPSLQLYRRRMLTALIGCLSADMLIYRGGKKIESRWIVGRT